MNESFNNHDHEEDNISKTVDQFSLIKEGKINSNGLLNLICLALFFLLVVYIYLSVPTFQILFDGSDILFLLVIAIIPLGHLGLSIFFLAKRYPQGWYFTVAYFTSSLLFTLIRLADSLYQAESGEPLIDGYVAAPLGELLTYTLIYLTTLYLLYREDIRSLLKISDNKRVVGILYGFLLFLFYSLITYFPVL